MNSNIPFDNNGPYGNFPDVYSNDPLVDKLIGNAYYVVRTVYQSLGKLDFLYKILSEHGMVFAVKNETELSELSDLAEFARIYNKDDKDEYQVIDYLFVKDDESGIKPKDKKRPGSWIVVSTSKQKDDEDESANYYGSYLPWIYNNGSADGGETTITIPANVIGVPFVVINDAWQFDTIDYSYDTETGVINFLGKELEEGDFVAVMRTGVPGTPDNPNVSNWVSVNWLYNNGSANGGEKIINIPYSFQSITAVYKNGIRYVKNLKDESYTVNVEEKFITLTESLTKGDRLVVQIGGNVAELTAPDRTIEEVARSVNVKNSEVILSSDLSSLLDSKRVLYDTASQLIYKLPGSLNGLTIKSFIDGELTYEPGNVKITLPVVQQLDVMRGFQFGETFKLESTNDLVFDSTSKLWWYWNGEYPKSVESSEIPNNNNWVTLGNKASFAITDIQSLLLVKPLNNMTVDVDAFHEGNGLGGGTFTYYSQLDKALHNGGTIIDPAKAMPSDWSDLTEVGNWLTASNTGQGCWQRRDTSNLSVSDFGCSVNDVVNPYLTKLDLLDVPSITLDVDTYMNSNITLVNIKNVIGKGRLLSSVGGIYTLYIMGTATQYSTLSAAVTAGSRTLTTATSGELVPGDYVALVNDVAYSFSAYRESYKTSELVEVSSVSGATITLKTPVIFAYPSGLTTKVIRVPKHEVSITGLNIPNGILQIRNSTKVDLDNVSVQTSVGNYAVFLGRCAEVSTRKLTAINTDTDDTKFGYGIMWSGVQDSQSTQGHFVGRRHGSATGSGIFDSLPSSLSIGVNFSDNCYFESSAQNVDNTAAYDNHGGSYNCHVVDSICNGGIVLGGKDASATNCSVTRTGLQFPLSFREVAGGDFSFNKLKVISSAGNGVLFGMHSSSEISLQTGPVNLKIDAKYTGPNTITNLIVIPNTSTTQPVNVTCSIDTNVTINDSVVYLWQSGTIGEIVIEKFKGTPPLRWLKHAGTLTANSLLTAPAVTLKGTLSVPKGGIAAVSFNLPTRVNAPYYSAKAVFKGGVDGLISSVRLGDDDTSSYQYYVRVVVADPLSLLSATQSVSVAVTIKADKMPLLIA